MDPQSPQLRVPDVGQAAPADEPTVSNDTDLRRQIADRINNAKNILVTVSSDPSVDELSSALGLVVLLDKLGKHATAVFSGKIPPAIKFLDPEALFEDNVDSLRDFIIALDKEKADKLRYKVEDQVVKIFITPYKTTISEKDLQFSQGDFNVDVVLALGVSKRDDLDKAIVAHGRILHDATVITVNAGQNKSDLGSIDWADSSASSIAEMLVGVSDNLGDNLLDQQMSTAFLTGIVAETNLFSNEKTSPKVMNSAARLMASGANQQLVASSLRQEGMLSETLRNKQEAKHDNGEMVVGHGEVEDNLAQADENSQNTENTETTKTSKRSKKSKKSNSDTETQLSLDKTPDEPPEIKEYFKEEHCS